MEETQLRRLMEACPVGVLVATPDGTPMLANRRLAGILRLPEDSGPEPRLDTLFAHRADLDQALAALQAGTPVEGREVALLRHDGSTCWVRLSMERSDLEGTPAVVAWIQDVTAQKAAREAAEQGERTLLEVLEQSPVAVGISDSEGRFLFWNSLFFRMGRQTLDARGNPSYGLGFVDDGLQARLLDALDRDGTVENVEAQVTFSDDTPAWVLVSMRHVEFEDKPAVLTWVYDITRLKEQEEALAEARREADVANQAKSDFLATMSHEIRTPMNGVLTTAEILDQTALTEEQKGMTTVIRDSATALLGIIDDILDFSKIEAGRLTLEAVSFSATQLVEGVADLLAMRAAEKAIGFVAYVDPRTPDHLEGDPYRLRQVLLNLAGNAIKFTDKGGVSIEVAAQAPTDGGAASLLFRITDTGIGISDEQMARLFQPFSQADSSTVRRYGGTGLGLSICKALVQMMGGEIGADSRPGDGSTFWFRVSLPVLEERRKLLDYDLDGIAVAIASGLDAEARAIGNYVLLLGGSPRFVERGEDLRAALADGCRVAVVDDGLPDLPQDRAAAILGEAGHGPDSLIALVPRATTLLSPDAMADMGSVVVPTPFHREELCRAIAAAAGRIAPEPPPTPRRRADDDGANVRYTPPDPEAARAAGVLFLVAEDNPTNQTVLRMLFDRLGLAAEIVADGRAALERLETDSFGMLITDCHMPGMDGYQLTESIRQQETATGRHLPIVALTADVLPDTAQKCRDCGMDAYLKKPVERASLLQVVRDHLPQALDLRQPDIAAEGQLADETPATQGPPVLDTGPLIDLMGGDDGMLGPLLADFLDTTRPLIDAATDALDAGDWETARKNAHSAAGAARTAGAMALAETCSTIEKAILEEDTAAAAALRDTVLAAFETTAEAVRSHE